MITRAQIRNFRCLVDVDLTFEPLTILVGPNASGKSAIIDALDRKQGSNLTNAFATLTRSEQPTFGTSRRAYRTEQSCYWRFS